MAGQGLGPEWPVPVFRKLAITDAGKFLLALRQQGVAGDEVAVVGDVG